MSDFHRVCTIKIFVLKDGIALIYVNIPLHQQALVCFLYCKQKCYQLKLHLLILENCEQEAKEVLNTYKISEWFNFEYISGGHLP